MILVTGNKGFVGTATTKLLKPWTGFDIMDGRDIRDYGQLRKAVESNKPSRILHLAAIARFADADSDPKLAHETNVIGTMNVARIAGEFHIPVVYASTGSVYMPIHEAPPITESFRACGNSVYGCTKYIGETYIRASGAPWIVLRYAHLYGPEKRHHGLIGGFLTRIQRGLEPQLYGGKQSNDFTYIDDVAQANVCALNASWDVWNQVYNIGTGEELTAEDAGRMVCSTWNYSGDIKTFEQRTVDPQRFVFDCSKAERMLGFRAKFRFQDGLKAMRDLAP